VAAAAAALALLGTVLGPAAAIAHGLVGRADLPIPAWLFGWAAAVVMVLSFVALATLWQEPKLETDSGYRTARDWLSFTLVNPATEFAAGLVGVGLLVVTIWSGFEGTQLATANFAPTFIYVIFWVGFVPASVLFGDVFKAFNPWRAIASSPRASPGRCRHRSSIRPGSGAGPRRRRSSASRGSSSRGSTGRTRARSRRPPWSTAS
jgi:uncharacterized membrane protein YjfL (UPF0719 family)